MTTSPRRGGRPTAEEARALSARIVDVATRMFLELGYRETTFERVAREAGTSKNALYLRYPEKADLFAVVARELVAQTYEEMIFDLDDTLPAAASLRRVSQALLDAATQPRAVAMFQLISASASQHPEIAQTAQGAWSFYIEQIQAYFEHRMGKGLLRLHDPRASAGIFAHLLFSQVHVALVHNKPIPTMEEQALHLDQMIRLFLAGIGAVEMVPRESVGSDA